MGPPSSVLSVQGLSGLCLVGRGWPAGHRVLEVWASTLGSLDQALQNSLDLVRYVFLVGLCRGLVGCQARQRLAVQVVLVEPVVQDLRACRWLLWLTGCLVAGTVENDSCLVMRVLFRACWGCLWWAPPASAGCGGDTWQADGMHAWMQGHTWVCSVASAWATGAWPNPLQAPSGTYVDRFCRRSATGPATCLSCTLGWH